MQLGRGVWGVLVTPFKQPGGQVDLPSLTRLMEHYATTGVTGLTVLGVFGEAASLSAAERRVVLEAATQATSLPLVVGSASLATAPAVEEIGLAHEILGDRLAGAMVQVNSSNNEQLGNHLAAVCEETGARLVVQDYPAASGVRTAPGQLIDVLRGRREIVAVKAEAPPTPVNIAALASELDVPVFGGLGGLGLLDELAVGAAGAMTGFSFPEGLVACTAAWEHGGYEAAREAFLPYLPLVNFEQQAGIALAIRKECLRQRGLIDDAFVRAPAATLPGSLLNQLGRHLTALDEAKAR